jgi:UDP-glucose 4-epimerase
MQFIIVGANGFIGTNLVRYLSLCGHEIFGVVISKKSDCTKIKRFCTNIVYGDIASVSSLDTGFGGLKAGAVFVDLAWMGVNGEDKRNYDVQINNIHALCNAALLAKQLQCSKIVFSGTVAENYVASLDKTEVGATQNFYAISKYCSRYFLSALCRQLNIPFIWAQFSNIYGPENKTGNMINYLMTKLSNNEYADFGPCDQPYDFVYIDDLIEELSALCKCTLCYGSYFLGSGSPRILKDYLQSAAKILGKEQFLRIGAKPADGIKYSYDMFDIEKLVKETGFKPSISFEEGIKRTILKNAN